MTGKAFHILWICIALLFSCNSESSAPNRDNFTLKKLEYLALPSRIGERPQTSKDIPHVQIGVSLVPEVHDEMILQIYSIPGVEDQVSVLTSWRALWLNDTLRINVPEAIIDRREFAHIHDDGSLHIFLEPVRADQAVEAGWADHHPFAVQSQEGWDGFVLLYTPQTFDELDVITQLIIDGYNYVTGSFYEKEN